MSMNEVKIPEWMAKAVEAGFLEFGDQKELATALTSRVMLRAVRELLAFSAQIKQSVGELDFSDPESRVQAASLQGESRGMVMAIEKLFELTNVKEENINDDQPGDNA